MANADSPGENGIDPSEIPRPNAAGVITIEFTVGGMLGDNVVMYPTAIMEKVKGKVVSEVRIFPRE